ncbi:MAG TPA: hypothetical protein VHX86_16880 [Tepidisphaeraceae bacterium]|jgi:hypothetical protein|nr:hypothetical protein [Tepidisphaeraceae bacterium]
MKHRPALYALIRLHSELAAQLKESEKQAGRIRENMQHVEAVLKLLEPTFNAAAIAAKRKNMRHALFKRGRALQLSLAILRAADKPLTADEIAAQVLRDHRRANPTEYQLSLARSAVYKVLDRHTELVMGDGKRPQRWSFIRG